MWRIVAWAIVLLAPLSAARAQDAKKADGEDLKVSGTLSADDPKDKVKTGSPHKVHEFKMKAGSIYIIDLMSQKFDAYLRLEDSTGKQLAEDDDSGAFLGGFPDARIVYKAVKDDTYRIIATSFDGRSGAYTLTVRPGTETYAKLAALKGEFQKGMQDVQQKAIDGREFDMEKYYSGAGELQAKFVDRYLQFAEENAKDINAAEAKMLAREMVIGMGNSPAEKIGEKLRTLIGKTKDQELLGQANLALGQHLAKRYEQAYRKKYADAAKIAKEAETVLEQTGKDFAALSAQVKDALFHLTKLAIGRTAMEIEAEDLDGKQFKLSDYRGKVVVIDFWGNW
jgi:hypothetical protein